MLRPQHALLDGQHGAVLGLGLGVLALLTQRIGQVIAAGQRVGMLRPQYALAGLDHGSQHFGGLAVITLINQHGSHAVQHARPFDRVALLAGEGGGGAVMLQGARVAEAELAVLTPPLRLSRQERGCEGRGVAVLETERSRGCDGGESGSSGQPSAVGCAVFHAQRTESVAPGEHCPRLLAANRTVSCLRASFWGAVAG